RGRPRRLVDDRPNHARGPREAPSRRLCPTGPARGDRAAAGSASVFGVSLPVLRLDADEAGEHLRPDAVPVAPLLRDLPPAVRTVQDDLARRLPFTNRAASAPRPPRSFVPQLT